MEGLVLHLGVQSLGEEPGRQAGQGKVEKERQAGNEGKTLPYKGQPEGTALEG